MNAVIIICSRQKSSRLPGKAFRKIAGVPALKILLDRVVGSRFPVVVAVPPSEVDTYRDFVGGMNVSVMGGNAESPLHRMAEVARSYAQMPDYLIRVTHDDILIDLESAIELLNEVHEQGAGYGVMPEIVDGAGVRQSYRNLLRRLTGAKSRLSS